MIPVIPGRASWREPGIQRYHALLDSGFARKCERPGMTGGGGTYNSRNWD
jgi:hypothetical protein